MTQELVVVHKRFVAAQPVTLQLKNKSWIRSDVAITDASTHTACFTVEEKMWSLSGKHKILDESGHEIATVKSGKSMSSKMKVSGEGFEFEVRCKPSVAVVTVCFAGSSLQVLQRKLFECSNATFLVCRCARLNARQSALAADNRLNHDDNMPLLVGLFFVLTADLESFSSTWR
jgi:uncharacterized membrane protein